jgi:hypothetical protein
MHSTRRSLSFQCTGGNPCRACQVHRSTCSYTPTTRRGLIQLLKPGPSRSTDPVPVKEKNVAQDNDGHGPAEEISLVNQSIKGDKGLLRDWLVLRSVVPSYRPRIRVNRLETDPFGNNGILLFLPNEDKKEHSHFWGEYSSAHNLQQEDMLLKDGSISFSKGATSYLAMQDHISRILQTKMKRSPGLGKVAFRHRRGEEELVRDSSVWRWGCQDYM